ncbi:MAG: nonstructural protein [Microvirus sp.]|nr:MAG: nonstructural protein [Microvirus sp.]
MKNVYMVYDKKAQCVIGAMITEVRDGPAIRAFRDALSADNKTVLSDHPSDFKLLCLGAIDDQGTLIPADNILTVDDGEYTDIPFNGDTR